MGVYDVVECGCWSGVPPSGLISGVSGSEDCCDICIWWNEARLGMGGSACGKTCWDWELRFIEPLCSEVLLACIQSLGSTGGFGVPVAENVQCFMVQQNLNVHASQIISPVIATLSRRTRQYGIYIFVVLTFGQGCCHKYYTLCV